MDVKQETEFISLRPAPSPGLARVLSRDREIRRRALEWQKAHGNAVEGLHEFLHELVGDDPKDIENWETLVEEPY